MADYTKNPPIDISDYTDRDMTFDGLCSPSDETYAVLGDLFLVSTLVYMLRKKYKKITPPIISGT